ncbi:MAG TPA: hypothetical protein VM120_06360 [Bryobacteraceae bacterium]|nr:hypothetical protein [Bryobacteraceae bacterium]
MMVYTIFEEAVDRLYELLDQVAKALENAGIPYQVVGGMAVFLHVQRAESDAGRLTRDVDLLVRREDLDRIAAAVEPYGFPARRGLDMLVDVSAPSARRAVHLVMSAGKIRPEYSEPAPVLAAAEKMRGAWIAPVADLVRMKLTSYRLKDRVHIQDMDEVGLITREMEASLSAVLKARLDEIRLSE